MRDLSFSTNLSCSWEKKSEETRKKNNACPVINPYTCVIVVARVVVNTSDPVRARAYIQKKEEEEIEEEERKESCAEYVWVACGPLITHGPFMDPRIRKRKSLSVCSLVYDACT